MSQIDFVFENGSLVLSDGGRRIEISPEISWKDSGEEEQTWHPFQEQVAEVRVDGLRLEARHPDLTFVAEISEEGRFAVTRSRVIPTARSGFLLKHIRWDSHRSSGFPAADKLVRRSLPYDVWGRCSVFPMNESTPESQVEYWRTAIFEPSDESSALTCSVKLPASWLHRFDFDGEGGWAFETLADATIHPGEIFENDAFAIQLCGDLNETLGGPESFRVARLAPSAGPLHAGWNSWDAYRLTVTEDDILENLEELQRHDWLRDLVRYVIIDDGWEDRVGQWDANEKFPHGMEWLADRIKAAGFIPGIWAAPFFAEPGSDIYDRNPEYCVQYKGAPYSPMALVGCGPPWGDRVYLDPTRPEVADHVYGMWRKFYSWGYRYFKTDFLANSWKLPGKKRDPAEPPDKPEPDFSGKLGIHDRELGLHRGHRRCMSAIRAAIGENSFWLGCGSVWGTGPELMDASRVSGDIDIKWSNLVKCGRNAFLNQHAHGRIWLNDPDFLVVRGRDTATPEQLEDFKVSMLNHSKPAYPESFTLQEARMWGAIVALSGGMVVLSDRLKWLNEAGLDILRTLAPLFSGAAGHVLAWEGDLPRVVLQVSPKGRLLGLFNWTEEETSPLRDKDVTHLPQCGWREIWSGTAFGKTGSLADLSLPAHSCALFKDS